MTTSRGMLPTGAGFARASTERLQDEIKTAEELLPELPREFKGDKKATMLWNDLMILRSATEWREGGRNDYEAAKGLVLCWMQLDDLYEDVKRDGYREVTSRGESKSNPDLAAIDSTTNRMLKLSRALKLGGGVGADLDDLQNVRRAEIVAKRTVSKAKLADANLNLLS